MNDNFFIDKINQSLLHEKDIKNVNKVLESGFLSRPEGGPFVKEFQLKMSKKFNQKYCFATNSGTSSLHLAVACLNLKPGDEVLVPALANIADCSVLFQENLKAVFVDINSNDFNINPTKIEEKITSKTKAIIVVHMYGYPVNLDEIIKIAKKHKIILIEDCAQAAGARYKGKYVGSFGDISCFSFYQTKQMVSGEGGMVATSHKKLAEVLGSIANNGIIKQDLDAYDYDRIGFNYQMSEIQAALIINQIDQLDSQNCQRRLRAKIYTDYLRKTDIKFQVQSPGTENAYFYLTGILPDKIASKRDKFLKFLQGDNVPIKKLYPLSLPEVKIVKAKTGNLNKTNCPVALGVTKKLFNLYVNPGLDKEDVLDFAKKIEKTYNLMIENEK